MSKPAFVVAVMLLFANTSTSRGARVDTPVDAVQLAAVSDVIVAGQVRATAAGWDQDTIYTYVTLDADRVLKGWMPERRITLKQLGGRVGDVTLAIDGQASFAPGEGVLLFLQIRPRDRTLSTTALRRGKWTIDRDAHTGERLARQPTSAESSWGAFGTPVTTISLAALEAGARSGGDAASTGVDINLQPRDAAAANATIGAAVLAASDAWLSEPGIVRLDTNRDCFIRFRDERAIVMTRVDPCGELSAAGGGSTIVGRWIRSASGDSASAAVLRRGVLSNRSELAAPASTQSTMPVASAAVINTLAGRFDRAVAALSAQVLQTTRVSVATDGTQADRPSRSPKITADGRFVAFVSYASTLAPGAVAGEPNVFLRDLQAGQTTLVAPRSDLPNITPDGRYLTYRSATDLPDQPKSLHVLDRQTGITTMLDSADSISDDFRYVASARSVFNCPEFFVTDRQTGTTRVGFFSGANPALSGDGSFVVYYDPCFTDGGTMLIDFASRVRQRLGDIAVPRGVRANRYVLLSPFLENYGSAIPPSIVIDRITGQSLQRSGGVSVSANGRFAVFASDTAPRDIERYDIQSGAIQRVGTTASGAAANGDASAPVVDDAGRVVFTSTASNLVDGDTNGTSDVFLAVGGTDARAPTEPRSLTARVTVAGAVATVDLSWLPPSAGDSPTSYVVEAGSAPGLSDLANFSNGAATSLRATVPVGFTAWVRIRAVNAAGVSPPSNEIRLTATAGTVPDPPTNLTGASFRGHAELWWVAPSAGRPVTYVIEAGSSPGASDRGSVATASPDTFLAANPALGTYYVRVRAQNSAGLGPPSNEVVLQVFNSGTCIPPQDGPTGLTIAVAGSTLTLTFGRVAFTTSYAVQAGTVLGASDIGTADIGFAVPAVITGVPSGTYYLRVRGRDVRCGLGPPSNEVVVTVP